MCRIVIRSRVSQKFESQQGFTLIECLMVITIAGILLSMAVPSYNNHVGDNRMRDTINDISGALQFARSQAIRLRRDVMVCASADGDSCLSSDKWEEGWVVSYIDGSGTRLVLKVHQGLEGGTLRSSGLSNASRVNFNRTGSLVQGEQGGSFIACDNRGASDANALVLSNLGFVHIAYDQDEDGIENDHSGTNVTCPNS